MNDAFLLTRVGDSSPQTHVGASPLIPEVAACLQKPENALPGMLLMEELTLGSPLNALNAAALSW